MNRDRSTSPPELQKKDSDYALPEKLVLAATISEIAKRETGETFFSDFEVRNCGA